MVAPGVVSLMLTDCAEEYVPPLGTKTGVAVARTML
jgi:hypothetical protein